MPAAARSAAHAPHQPLARALAFLDVDRGPGGTPRAGPTRNLMSPATASMTMGDTNGIVASVSQNWRRLTESRCRTRPRN